MKKLLTTLAALVALALPSTIFAQTYIANAGVSFFTGSVATATVVSGNVRLPNFSGAGTLNITESGVTGSPSGCTIVLKYQQNNATVATSAISTTSFTPSTGTQQFYIVPTIAPTGDSYTATYACSSTYPTAGLISVSFSPTQTEVIANVSGAGDPCKNPSAATSSVVINTSGASTTQLVAASAGKAVYVCQATFSVSATTATAVFEYSTVTNCASGTTALTGAMAGAANTQITMGWGGAIVTAPAGNALCIVNGGTGTQTGVLSYVQQ